MLQAMYNGVSAIDAISQGMDVIGNNIANVNTTAYKGSTVTFADQLSETIKGASIATSTIGGTDGEQVGLGTKIGSISVNGSQGSLLSTNVPTDLAIQGNGYFETASTTGQPNYTRDGHFALDSSGNLVSATNGQYVLGWTANNAGQISTSTAVTGASHINIPVGTLTCSQATTGVTGSGNLDATAAATSTTNAAATPAVAAENSAITVTAYDSLGTAHAVTLTLTPTSNGATPPVYTPNSWTWTASSTEAGLISPGGTAPNSINTGTITFDSTGAETAMTGSLKLTPTNGATTPQNVTVNLSSVTQKTPDAGQTGSSATITANDGAPIGTLESFAIDGNGIIDGTFSNGLTRALGQVAVATFPNPTGLASSGSDSYTATANSGIATTTTANANGAGSINAGYLEQSNVDLGTELTNMIVQQRGYEANTKIVTTVDTLLGDLMQMVQ